MDSLERERTASPYPTNAFVPRPPNTGELEDALSGDKLEPASSSSAPAPSSDPSSSSSTPPLLLSASGALLRCLRRAASPEVVLPPLTDRFLRLALQLAQRYATWVLAATAARREAAAAAAAAGAGAPPGTPGAAAPGGGVGAGSPGAGGAGGGAGGAAASGPAAWAVGLPAEELMAVVHDAEAVSGRRGRWGQVGSVVRCEER
mgnify:CR=1 FL=1